MSSRHNELPNDIFLFGASYAPYAKAMDWPMEEWEQDFKTMKRLSFNTIRVFAAWDRIEMNEGVFNYEKQDYLFNLASKYQIKVILNFGGLFGNLCSLYQPRYLIDNHYCQERMESPEVQKRHSTVAVSLCPDDPLYREKAFKFMENTVKRYASREELLAWMIWNEPASPFCYCPHTLTRFRDYLREKYQGDIERLNTVWSSEFPVCFKTWDSIPFPGGALTMWHDWVRFNQHKLSEDLGMITDLTHKFDPGKRPTTSNIVYHMAALEGPVSAPRYGLDIGRAGQGMTIMGVSCYTVEHMYDPGPGYLTAYKLSRLRGASQDEKKRMLVLETGAGPNKRMLTREQRIQTFWHLIAHNAKSILLWNYRSRLTDSQVSLFHLMKWDGSVSPRGECAGAFSKMLQKNAKLLNKVFVEKQAAILTLEEDQILMESLCSSYGPMEYPAMHDSRIGAYKLLWDMQIPADCIAENNLEDMNQYKLLLLPMAEHMTAETAERIRRFVYEGGTVIAESPFAFRDGEGRLQYQAPAFGLEEVFGCRTSDREGRETAFEICCQSGNAEVCMFWCRYELHGGEAIACYADGGAAVVRNSYGKGRAVLAGTEVFRQYVQQEQSAMTDLLRKEILSSGAEPTALLSGVCDNIEVNRLTGENAWVCIIINHNDTERKFRIKLKEADASLINMVTGLPVDLLGEVILQGREVMAVKFE